MTTVGRNDPCPCGSGKKYKKCCGETTPLTTASGYDRIRRLDAESANLLMKFAKQRYGEESLENAWADFFFFDDSHFDMSDPEADSFLRWFVFNWRPHEKETLAELFLSEKGSRIDNDLRRFVEATIRSPYSFFQALDVDPGKGLTLRDVLRKGEFRVREGTASTILQRGHILYARVVEWDGICFLMGNGSCVIPPPFLGRLLDLRALLEEEKELVDGSLTAETLIDHEDDLREAYFQTEDDIKDAHLEIRNTDGDPLALHTLTYSIPSFEEAFHALKDLEQNVSGGTDDAFVERSGSGSAPQPKAIIHWLKGGKKEEGNTLLGTLKVSDTTLIVDVNSDKRSRRIQKEINKRLGTDALLLRTEIQSHEGLMKEVNEKHLTKDDQDAESPQESEHDRLMRESPEARALMKGMMERHWATWPDKPLPALRGMTPRQAARDPAGRELLDSVLMDFDLHTSAQEDEFLRVDTAKLRRELELEGR